MCSEEGQHFKEYAVAQDFDPERFQLKNAELGAAKASKTLWTWLWSSSALVKPRPPLEFGFRVRARARGAWPGQVQRRGRFGGGSADRGPRGGLRGGAVMSETCL